MKISFLVILFSAIISNGYAQNDGEKTAEEKKKALQDALQNRFMLESPNRTIPNKTMPNGVKIIPIKPIYKGQNSMGFDIYESPLDKMPILMPDSSFQVVMPNAGLQPTIKSLTLTDKATPDILPKKPWEPQLYVVPKKKKP